MGLGAFKLTLVVFRTASEWYARALRQLELRLDFCVYWAFQYGVFLGRGQGVYCFTLASVHIRGVTGTGGYSCNYGVRPTGTDLHATTAP